MHASFPLFHYFRHHSPSLSSNPLLIFTKEINVTPHISLLHPPTSSIILPKRPQKRCLRILLIMDSHDGFDGIGSFDGVVEWDSTCVMVQNVGGDGTVEEILID